MEYTPELEAQAFHEEIDAALQPIIERVQAWLRTLEGQRPESFKERRRLAAIIQEIVGRLEMALVCPHPSCGIPSRLRCSKAGRSITGVFQFDHIIKQSPQAHSVGGVVPALTLIKKPADRRKTILAENDESTENV